MANSKEVAERARAASAAAGDAAGAALARPGAGGAELATSTRLLDFKRTLDEETAMRRLLGDWIKENMVKDTDFGVIPGTDKPTLYKPGAEKLIALFKCTPVYRLEKTEVYASEGVKPFFAYQFRCRLVLDSGKVLAEGYGSANSHESKYRYRYERPRCPSCKQETIFKSKKGTGFFCWKKQGGCGAEFVGEQERLITEQPVGKVEDKDVADKANTLLKMAEKRAKVDAAIALARVSDMFTQDVEDHRDEPSEEPPFTPGDGPPGEEPPPPGEAAAAPASRTAAAKDRMKGKAASTGNGTAPARDEGPIMEIGEREGPNAVRGKPIRTLDEPTIRAHITVGVDWLGDEKSQKSQNRAKVSQCVDDLKAELLRRGLPAWEPKTATPADASKPAASPPATPPTPPQEEERQPGDDQDEIPFGGAA